LDPRAFRTIRPWLGFACWSLSARLSAIPVQSTSPLRLQKGNRWVTAAQRTITSE
jgi:hypothetical protein